MGVVVAMCTAGVMAGVPATPALAATAVGPGSVTAVITGAVSANQFIGLQLAGVFTAPDGSCAGQVTAYNIAVNETPIVPANGPLPGLALAYGTFDDGGGLGPGFIGGCTTISGNISGDPTVRANNPFGADYVRVGVVALAVVDVDNLTIAGGPAAPPIPTVAVVTAIPGAGALLAPSGGCLFLGLNCSLIAGVAAGATA